jgi:SPP1 gp7 family putative phage head morphogenesis protein
VAEPANASIQDTLIGNQVDLLKLEGTVRTDVLAVLKELETDIVKRLNAVDPTAPALTVYQQTRLEKLLKQVQKVTGSSFAKARRVTNATLEQLAALESGLVSGAYDVALGTSLGVPTLNRQILQEIVKDGLIQGAPSSEWWAKQAANTLDSFRREMRMGVLAGESIGQLTTRVRKIMDVTRRQAEALARTSVQSISNLARLRTYQENAHLLNGIQWISTLDSRTTDICKGLDGLMWDTELQPIGHDTSFPGPTAHWNCRSTQVPITKSWDQLRTSSSAKAKAFAKKADQAGSGARSALDGTIPASLNYEEWLLLKEKAEPGFALKSGALTPSKYALWKQGKLNFKDLIDQSANPITVAQLQERLKDIIPSTALPAAALQAQQTVVASSGAFGSKTSQAAAESQSAKAVMEARVEAAKQAAAVNAKADAQATFKSYTNKATAPSSYHFNALKTLTKQKGGAYIDDLRKNDPIALVAQIDKMAAAKKLSVDLAHYKQAVVKGKKPSAAAQAAFETLPDVAQKDVLDSIKIKIAEIEAKAAAEKLAAEKAAQAAAANEAAAAEIAAILANPKGKTKLAKALTDAAKDPELKNLSPARQLAAAKEKAAAIQAQAEKSATLTGYKKKVLSGENPTPKQAEVFLTLSSDETSALAAQINALEESLDNYIFAKASGLTPTKAQTKAFNFLTPKAKKGIPAKIQAAKKDIGVAEVEAALDEKALVGSYKKKLIDGEVPSAAEANAFNKLDDATKGQILNEVDSAQLKAAQKATKPIEAAGEAPVKPKPIAPEPKGPNVDNMTQIGPQKGSNQGGLFQDKDTGEKFYLKFPDSEDIARNEVLASKLYQAAGVDGPEVYLIRRNGKVGVASRFVDGLKESKKLVTNGKTPGIADGFMTDAWLANWDVAGLKFDNLVIKNGKAFRIDVGGALRYRAMGGAKGTAFNKTVAEVDTLLDKAKNRQAAEVFGAFETKDLEQGVLRVIAVSDQTIKDLVQQYGPKAAAERTKLANTLIARKNYLAKKYAKLTKEYKTLQAQALSDAKADVAGAIREIDNKVTTAIKGIALRAGKNADLEPKDLQRVTDLEIELAGFMRQQGPKLTQEARDQIEAYYGAWVDDLKDAVSPGAGKPAKWNAGWFDGYKGTPTIDESAIKVDLAFLGNGRERINKAAGQKILKDAGVTMSSHLKPARGAFKDLDDHHIAAIRSFTGSHYSTINRELRRPGVSRRSASEYERLLNQALAYSTKYVGESTRGIRLSGREFDEFMSGIREAFENGKTWSDNGFMSSSKGTQAAFGGNIKLHFQGKTGVYVRPISHHPSENEVLFGTEARFLVNKIEERGTTTHIYFTEVLQ